VLAIINTHAHYDHIGAVQYLKNKYQLPFFLHSADSRLLKSANLYARLFDETSILKIPKVDYYFDQINIEDHLEVFSIKIIETPGHTQGSVCFLIEDVLFTGDTIFNGDIGRVDLPGGNSKTLHESLRVLSKLPKQTKIYPGHGASSTIEHELNTNKKFKMAIS
jgi:hydroxyacylglutathione hydrolase